MTGLGFTPLLLPAPAAAHYLGVSESKLRMLGIRRKVLDSKRLYDRRDLDAYANELRYEGEAAVGARRRYRSLCDPRLNRTQSHDIAGRVVERWRQSGPQPVTSPRTPTQWTSAAPAAA